jgi:dihydroxyacetone kinase-like protein
MRIDDETPGGEFAEYAEHAKIPNRPKRHTEPAGFAPFPGPDEEPPAVDSTVEAALDSTVEAASFASGAVDAALPDPADAGAAADAAFAEAWMRRFAASVAATEDELTALDQRSGDGDFGTNLRAGVDAALAALDGASDVRRKPAGPLEAAATAFLDEVGGTSGPLFGLVFQELAGAVAAAGALTAAALADGTAAGLAAVQRVGEAEPGDKTLVDALHPAALALRGCAPAATPAEALRSAAAGAWEGVRTTARLRARRGRASYLGERASGVPDPGAVGVGLIFSAAHAEVTSLAPLLDGR